MAVVRTPRREHTVAHDRVDGWTTLTQAMDEGRLRFLDNGLEVEVSGTQTVAVREGDPLSMRQRIRAVTEFQRGDWRTRVETDSVLAADETHFQVSYHMDAFEGDTRVFSKSWVKSIPRDNL